MTIIGKEITPKLLRKILGFSVLGLLAVGVLVYFGLIWREKAQFTQAEKEIDALYAQIVEKVGKPDQEKKEKSCDRPNLKYKKGPLSCSVSTYLLYENKNLLMSNELLKNMSALSNQPLRIGSAAAKANTFNELARKDWDQTFFQHFDANKALSCNLSYTYPSVEQEVFELAPAEALLVGIDCYRSALAEYFPMKN